jgi:hypothetical protein
MALVGHISGSSQTSSVIGISGSVIVADRPGSKFPLFPGSDISFFVSGAIGGRSSLQREISSFGGDLVVSGASYHDGGIYASSISGSGNFEVGGDLRVAGDIRVDGNDIKDATGNSAITFSDGNVIIPGDLTVNGTTVTIDATNLEIEDALIGLGFNSGSVAVAAGDRGFIGGISSGDNVTVFWDNSATEFAVARTNTTPGGTSINVTSYAQFHALGITGSLTKLSNGSDYLRAGSNIQLTTGSSGEVTVDVTGLSGYVVGPSSATDGAIALYDGSTGKLIKNSDLLIGKVISAQAYVTASVSLTNYGFALIPNGTGSLSAQAPDGTTSGGNPRGAYSTDWQRSRISADQISSGEYSTIAGGLNNAASGNFSSILGGNGNQATKYASIAGGDSNLSTNSGSVALGVTNTASHTGSVALGFNNSASGFTTFTAGRYNQAPGDGSIALGIGNYAPGDYSVGIGSDNNTSGGWAFAIGRQNSISGIQGAALGSYNSVINSNSVALGLENIVSGSVAITLGGNNIAIGNYSIAGGAGNITQGAYSIAAGQLNKANANWSVALGNNSLSNGNTSFALGQQVTASSMSELVIGQYARTVTGNVSSFVLTDRLFVAGNGVDDSNRSDALQLFKDGNLHISGTLTIMSGATSSVTFPTTRGNSGEVLTSDGAGLITWSSVAGSSEYFSSTTVGSIYTTGSAAFIGTESIDSPSDKGSDVFFYVSGSTDGASMALFGGCITASGSLKVDGDVQLGALPSSNISFIGQVGTDILPGDDMLYNLGSPSYRWANVYTGDLHLRNDRGDWTVIEEDDYLSIRNNKTGKMFKFVLEPV